MHDLLIHELGSRRVHWRYDDPSGVPDPGPRVPTKAIRSAGETRVRARRGLSIGVV